MPCAPAARGCPAGFVPAWERRCGTLPDSEPQSGQQAASLAGGLHRPAGRDHARADELPEWAEKLRGIQSITDRALSGLDPQELLEALVERVRDALQADTAAVLLLDHPSGQLVATAAAGLEDEVRQGVRIQIGRGFAGQIAAQRRPVILDEVDHGKVVNPILLAKGIRSLMGAPLMSDGVVMGVLHVGTLRPRKFTSQDVDLLQLAADRAALAVQALAAQLDRAAASALQRSLLPAGLPSVDGISMAARYVPGTGNVGGDWYDVFILPAGQLCAVIGDVAGSGLRAAAIMGRIRSALRAYALETSDPADILSRLERKLHYFEPDAMVTVLCAVFSPTPAGVPGDVPGRRGSLDGPARRRRPAGGDRRHQLGRRGQPAGGRGRRASRGHHRRHDRHELL